MRTIDARDLDVPAEELLEYLKVNIRMNLSQAEQEIIVTPTQLQNIENIHPLYTTSVAGYRCTFLGINVTVKEREVPPRPFGIYPQQQEAMARSIEDYARLEELAVADSFRREYEPKKTTKAKKKEAKQPERQRRVPVWQD